MLIENYSFIKNQKMKKSTFIVAMLICINQLFAQNKTQVFAQLQSYLDKAEGEKMIKLDFYKKKENYIIGPQKISESVCSYSDKKKERKQDLVYTWYSNIKWQSLSTILLFQTGYDNDPSTSELEFRFDDYVSIEEGQLQGASSNRKNTSAFIRYKFRRSDYEAIKPLVERLKSFYFRDKSSIMADVQNLLNRANGKKYVHPNFKTTQYLIGEQVCKMNTFKITRKSINSNGLSDEPQTMQYTGFTWIPSSSNFTSMYATQDKQGELTQLTYEFKLFGPNVITSSTKGSQSEKGKVMDLYILTSDKTQFMQYIRELEKSLNNY